MYGIDEAAVLNRHREVDRIEVDLALASDGRADDNTRFCWEEGRAVTAKSTGLLLFFYALTANQTKTKAGF